MDTVVRATADYVESPESASPETSVQAISVVSRAKDSTDTLTSHILMWSFVTAVLLAIAGFAVVAIYLFSYLRHAFDAFSPATMDQFAKMDSGTMQSILVARAGLWKFILQSCGVIAGVAFGFLGFALFLLGAKGDMDAAFDDSQHKVQLTRMAPGSFVILIAAILIGICCYQRVTVNLPTVETDKVLSKPAANDPNSADLNSIAPPDQPPSGGGTTAGKTRSPAAKSTP
jgi:hypothetical protein